MKATITGHDSLSKRILVDLDSGLRVSSIPEHYPVSLDQAKRLSRYRNMLELAKENVEEEFYERLQRLGIRSLPLGRLFRQSDWGGVREILSVVTEETTRDELQLLLHGLEDKRQRILEMKEHTDLILRELEDRDGQLAMKEKELLQLKREMDEHLKLFKGFREPITSFLREYLSWHEGSWFLAKNVHPDWQSDLRKKGMIDQEEDGSAYFIKEFQAFVEELKGRYERGWEVRGSEGSYHLPSFGESRLKVNHEVEEIREERGTIQTQIRQVQNGTLDSYRNMMEGSEFLSTLDLKRHKELQRRALQWLFQRGFVTVADLPLPNGKKADIWAYNESHVVILDIKVSYGDFVTDRNWTELLPYCHEFYFLTPSTLTDHVEEFMKEVNCGQCVETEDSIRMVKPDERVVKEVLQEQELKFAAGQLLSRRLIYGY